MMRSQFTRLDARSVGFTLVEIAVALAVILILAAVALPNLTGYLDQKRVDSAVERLTIAANGVYDNTGNKEGFYQKVGAHPGKLSQLTSAITSDGTTKDLCNASFSKGEVTNWTNNAPFVNFYIDPSGMPTGVGTANDQLTREQVSGLWTSRIDIPNATPEDAAALDETADGSTGQAAGYVRWTTTGNTVTIHIHVPINNSC